MLAPYGSLSHRLCMELVIFDRCQNKNCLAARAHTLQSHRSQTWDQFPSALSFSISPDHCWGEAWLHHLNIYSPWVHPLPPRSSSNFVHSVRQKKLHLFLLDMPQIIIAYKGRTEPGNEFLKAIIQHPKQLLSVSTGKWKKSSDLYPIKAQPGKKNQMWHI